MKFIDHRYLKLYGITLKLLKPDFVTQARVNLDWLNHIRQIQFFLIHICTCSYTVTCQLRNSSSLHNYTCHVLNCIITISYVTSISLRITPLSLSISLSPSSGFRIISDNMSTPIIQEIIITNNCTGKTVDLQVGMSLVRDFA